MGKTRRLKCKTHAHEKSGLNLPTKLDGKGHKARGTVKSGEGEEGGEMWGGEPTVSSGGESTRGTKVPETMSGVCAFKTGRQKKGDSFRNQNSTRGLSLKLIG